MAECRTDYSPLSEERAVIALQGALERLIFAFTMGLFALVGTVILWVVSLPSVALRIVRWKISTVSDTNKRVLRIVSVHACSGEFLLPDGACYGRGVDTMLQSFMRFLT